MALSKIAAGIACTAAAGAYLDAKLHLRKDIDAIRLTKNREKEYAKLVKQNSYSAFFLFEKSVKDFANATAIWSRTGSYTWQEVHTRACQYASYFLSLGVRPGQFVAFYLQNSPEFMFAWLGLWAIGCAPAMINYNLASDALVHCLRVCGADVMLVDVDEGCQNRIQGEKTRIEGELHMKICTMSGGLTSEIATGDAARPDVKYRANVKGDSPAVLFYTSGTTGMPKAFPFLMERIALTGIGAPALWGQKRGPGGDRWYNCMPYYHGTGGVCAISNMMSGISLAIGRRFSLSTFWDDVRESESTFFVYVGEVARYLLSAPPSPKDQKHRIRCMYGNGLRPDVWKRFQERFAIPEVAEFFSSTEGMFSTAVWSRGPFTQETVGHHGFLLRKFFQNVYVPVEIDAETGDIERTDGGLAKRKSYNEGGELLVQVPSRQAWPGYWKSPQATSKKFVQDILRKGDLYYRSGDALRRTDDGRWFFIDRLGDTFRWKSENVSTAEVAEVLGRYPGVLDANVYGVLVPKHDGRAGCAAVVIALSEKGRFDWKAFAAFVREKLPRYAVPVFVRIVDEEGGGKGTHNNKQNKVPLREEGVDPAARGTRVARGEHDQVYWLRPGADEYVVFREKDWRGLVGGGARL